MFLSWQHLFSPLLEQLPFLLSSQALPVITSQAKLNAAKKETLLPYLMHVIKFRQSEVQLQDSSLRRIANLCNLSWIVGKAKKWWFEVEVFDLKANFKVNIEYHSATYQIIYSHFRVINQICICVIGVTCIKVK